MEIRPTPILPSQHWLLKNAKPILKNPLGFFMEQFADYGDFYCANTPRRQSYVATHPDYVKWILVEGRKVFVKSDDYEVLKLSLGNGLLTSEGEFWQRQRRIAQPAFHRDSLQGLVKVMADCTQARGDLWKQNGSASLNICEEMMALTLDIVSRSLFGSQIDPTHYKNIQQAMVVGNHFLSKRISNPLRFPMWLPLPAHRRFYREKRVVAGIITDIIEQRRKNTADRPFDLLTMLLDARDEETGEGMTDQQLRDEVVTLFLAGHETTANALSWLFYLLGQHPEVVAKLEAEVQTVLPTDGVVAVEHLPRLEYTQQVVEESMRLYPPAWTIVRKAAEDTVLNGYEIPAQGHIVLNIYGIHRHPAFWERPNDFVPERFEAEKKKLYEKYMYVPFGAGQRMCIGNNFAMMEMKAVVAMLVHRFRFRLLNTKPVQWESLITLRPIEGIFMNAEL